MKILKGLLMIITAPVILVLTLFVWLCTGLIYISGLVLGLFSTVIALLGVAVLLTYSPQNGAILLVMAFLISPMGLPLAAIWLLGKVQSLKFAIQDRVYKTSLSIKKAALQRKAALSIFFRLCSLLRFEVTAQPLLKALHNKAFRYAIMLQRFGRHTLLPTLYYYYMQL